MADAADPDRVADAGALTLAPACPSLWDAFVATATGARLLAAYDAACEGAAAPRVGSAAGEGPTAGGGSAAGGGAAAASPLGPASPPQHGCPSAGALLDASQRLLAGGNPVPVPLMQATAAGLDLVDRGDAARAERVHAGVGIAAGITAGQRGPETVDQLRRRVMRRTAAALGPAAGTLERALESGGARPLAPAPQAGRACVAAVQGWCQPGPDASDPAALVPYFTAAQASVVAPRCARGYGEASRALPPPSCDAGASSAAAPPQRLPLISASGLFAAHLTFCPACRAAEAAGVADPSCPFGIHTYCSIAGDGFMLPWAGGAAPAPGAIASVRVAPASVQAASRAATGSDLAELDFARREFARLEGAGVLSKITDPAVLAAIDAPGSRYVVTQASIVAKRSYRPPDSVARGAGGADYDDASVAESAAQAGAADAEVYARLLPRNAPQQHEQVLEEATGHRRTDPKYRFVTRFDQTLNPHLADAPLSYDTIDDFVAGIQPGDALTTFDWTDAYYGLRPHASERHLYVVQDPFDGGLYFLDGLPMGLSVSCALFAAVAAIPRLALAASTPARDGRVHVQGLLDDTGMAVAPVALDLQTAWAYYVFEAGRFVVSERKRQTTSAAARGINYLGAHINADTRTARMKREKYWGVCYEVAFFDSLLTRTSADRDHYPSGCFLPLAAWRSFVGSIGWAAMFDRVLRVHSKGLQAGLTLAEKLAASKRRSGCFKLAAGEPAAADLGYLAARVRGGRLRGRLLSLAPTQAVGLQCLPCPAPTLSPEETTLRAAGTSALGCASPDDVQRVRRLFQLVPVPKPAGAATAAVVAVTSDASVGPGPGSAWGYLVSTPDGSHAAEWAEGAPGEHSDTLEIAAPAAAVVRHAREWARGSTVIVATDSISVFYRINRGAAAYGGPALLHLQALFDAADAADLSVLAVWLPRASNQFLDALADCRDDQAARALIERLGLRRAGT